MVCSNKRKLFDWCRERVEMSDEFWKTAPLLFNEFVLGD
jgi:hypothetical protein